MTEKLHLAFSLPLSGQQLIEASAGTGKTWTISTLIVRLLFANTPTSPHVINLSQILITTFTRAAAAELKTKISTRIHEIHDLFAHLSFDEAMARAASTNNDLATYLLSTWGAAHFTQNRTHVADTLAIIDDLFVGTLDSTWQKLLKEFAFDSTSAKPRKLIMQERDQLLYLITNVLRDELAKLPETLVETLLQLGLLSTQITTYLDISKSALNYYQTPIHIPSTVQIQWSDIEETCQQLHTFSNASWQEYCHILTDPAFDKTKAKKWLSFIEIIISNPVPHQYAYLLPEKIIEYAQSSPSILFKKSASEAFIQHFMDAPQTKAIMALAHLRQQLSVLADALYAQIIVRIRQQFATYLARSNATTFTLQTQLLLDSIRGNNALATHIGRHYPILIVDEFQDTDEQQNELLQTLHAASPHPHKALLMVGDPKQAIYQFRGADVYAYLQIKSQLPQAQQYQLTTNHRSTPLLINALNQFFLSHPSFEAGIDYHAVQASPHMQSQCYEHTSPDTQPMHLIPIAADGDMAKYACQQVIQLLHSAAASNLSIDQRRVIPSDIAILAEKQKELDAIEAILIAQHIPVFRRARHSVFSRPLATELYILMQALLAPSEPKIRRRLQAGHFFGHSLLQLNTLDVLRDEQLIHTLGTAFERWSIHNFSDAWRILNQALDIWGALPSANDFIDLRQLLALIHNASKSLAPTELISWMRQKITGARTNEIGEEEQIQHLHTGHGVQLMTIHTAKGLEFPIVVMSSIQASAKPKSPIFWRTPWQTNQTRYLARWHPSDKNAYQQSQAGEKRRLLYVAMTRAKLRLYILHKSSDDPESKVVDYLDPWLKSTAWGTHLHTGQHLAAVHISPNLTQHDWDAYTTQPSIHGMPDTTQHSVDLSHQPQDIGRRLIPWSQTSFSALIRHAHLIQANESGALLLPDGTPAQGAAIDEAESAIAATSEFTPLLDTTDIRFTFPKGAHSGSCLHQILEYIHPTNTQDWQRTFDKQLKAFGIEIADTHLMHDWFHDIMHTPLIGNFSLAQIQQSQRIRELAFSLSLTHDQLNTDALYTLFRTQNMPLPKLSVPDQTRFLNGAIDLTFVHQGKYYIADYKNSFLGTQLSDYQPHHLATHMHDSHYFLQAAIYQLTLHRLLKQRLPNYQASTHLGGALYLYLRGMKQQHNTVYGVYHWQPSVTFIEQFDALLG